MCPGHRWGKVTSVKRLNNRNTTATSKNAGANPLNAQALAHGDHKENRGQEHGNPRTRVALLASGCSRVELVRRF
jgi:hypothetical protein